jgi:chromosomal replication initiator protein
MIMLSQIDSAVCGKFNITPRELHGQNRCRRIAHPRQVAYYLGRKLTEKSLPQLGLHYGGRDHTSVLHGYREVLKRMSADPVLAVELQDLAEAIRSAGPTPFERAARDFAHNARQLTVDLSVTG